MVAASKKFYPMGASQNFIDRRDEEIKQAKVDEQGDQRELIRQLRAEIKRLKGIIANMRSSKPTPPAGSGRKKPPPPPPQPAICVEIDGVLWVNVGWIMRKTGLSQSAVSRKLSKLEIKPKHGMYPKLFPKTQAENITRNPKKRKR